MNFSESVLHLDILDKSDVGQTGDLKMTELFLVLYSPKDETLWECYSTVHDLSVAADISLELNTKGFRTNVQSVLLDEYGQVTDD